MTPSPSNKSETTAHVSTNTATRPIPETEQEFSKKKELHFEYHVKNAQQTDRDSGAPSGHDRRQAAQCIACPVKSHNYLWLVVVPSGKTPVGPLVVWVFVKSLASCGCCGRIHYANVPAKDPTRITMTTATQMRIMIFFYSHNKNNGQITRMIQ